MVQVHCADEAAAFQKIASALLVNVGTLSPDWVAGMELAAKTANELKKPWVLDPVAAGATPFRTEVRCNGDMSYSTPDRLAVDRSSSNAVVRHAYAHAKTAKDARN